LNTRFIEVSHVIRAGLKIYPGLPAPEQVVLRDYQALGDPKGPRGRAEFFIASLHLCGNTGTYVDAPVHRFRNAADLSELPLNKLAHLPILAVSSLDPPSRGIGPELFSGLDLTRPAHTKLLHAGVPICEHMTNLSALIGVSGRLHAVPIAWQGGASFPVRAYVIADV
jgi:kynurenine formamidase